MPKIASPKLEKTCYFGFHATVKAILLTLVEKKEILRDKTPQTKTKNKSFPGRLPLRLGTVMFSSMLMERNLHTRISKLD